MKVTGVISFGQFLKRGIIFSFCALTAATTTAQVCGNNGLPERSVYIIAGQSNAAGLANVDDSSKNPAIQDFFSQSTIYPNVQIYGIYGAPPGVLNMDDRFTANSVAWSSYAGWGAARPGYGFKNLDLYRAYIGSADSNDVLAKKLFGPELGMAAFLNSAPTEQFIVKLAIAGSALANVPEANWSPNNHLYKELLKMVSAAYASKSSQFNLKVKGIVFMQGETDSETWPTANAYQANLTNFISTLRNDLYSRQCATTNQIPFVIGRVQDNVAWGARLSTRIAQQNIDKLSGLVAMANTDDLDQNMLPGGHFNEYGQAHLGSRFYHALNVPFPPSDFIFRIQKPDGTSHFQPFYTNGGQYCCVDASATSNIQNYIPSGNHYVNACGGYTCSVAPGY